MSKPKTVMVIGSGGREHALAWKLAQSPRVGKIYVAPGNGGTGSFAENVPIPVTNIEDLARFAKDNQVDLTVVGPDDVLASGVVNCFQLNHLPVFGPTKNATQIESSKVFAKDLMKRKGIPTASFEAFSDHAKAHAYCQKQTYPLVVKADGLALGKGAYVCNNFMEAQTALHKIMLARVHRGAGNAVVIEDYLVGPEISCHAFSDGMSFACLPPAQDHKPLLANNLGPNTGGMGTIVPVPWVTDDQMRFIGAKIIEPTLDTLAREGYRFSGLLYPGLKMTKDGPKVLEFNARFGDPETQSYMRLLKTDLLEILEACIRGNLSDIVIEWHKGFAVTVVIASGGYPGDYQKGKLITGLEAVRTIPGVEVFHAGTTYDNGQFKTSGGRVLGVSAVGATLQEALDLAYEGVYCINFDNMYYRLDIGVNALAHQLQAPV